MSKRLLSYSLLFLIIGIVTGCKEKDTKKQPEIAVANSYLLSIVKDLCGEQTEVMCFVPPGMCPGHFDISPEQVKQLSKCKVLLLFDFQSGIGNALNRLKDRGLNIYAIEAPDGLCLPETYLKVARSVADAISKDDPAKRIEYSKRIELLEKHMHTLTSEINTKIQQAGLKGGDVLVSWHQAEFTKWLGLNTVATFAGSDIETPSRINAALMETKDKNIKLVIANQQEGTGLATTLATRLNAKMVVFSNFPEEGTSNVLQPSFDVLLKNNVDNLLKACK